MRRLVTTVLVTLMTLWLTILPAMAIEGGEETSETPQIEGGGDNAFLYLFVFGVVWGVVVFFDARTHAPEGEGGHHDGAHH